MKVTQNLESSLSKYNAPKTVDFRVKYKTEKCRYWEQQGYCPFGQMCAFVHSCIQMRPKEEIHSHYKTKPCLNFNKYGYCKYGERCLFLHVTANVDRQRTRSNSPVQASSPLKISNKHQQNLKILSQYGFSVFEAHMRRSHSKVLKGDNNEQQCNRTIASTQPQAANYQNIQAGQNAQNYEACIPQYFSICPAIYFQVEASDAQGQALALAQCKKTRMYSM